MKLPDGHIHNGSAYRNKAITESGPDTGQGHSLLIVRQINIEYLLADKYKAMSLLGV